MTVRDTDQYLQCIYPSPWEHDGITGWRPCGYPTSRVEYAELDPNQPPELQNTVRPICHIHEIALYLGQTKDVE
jgi:hypothetical protein